MTAGKRCGMLRTLRDDKRSLSFHRLKRSLSWSVARQSCVRRFGDDSSEGFNRFAMLHAHRAASNLTLPPTELIMVR